MKKLFSTFLVLGLLLCTPSYSHDEERFIFLSCNGEFPSSISSIYNKELIKIDLKKSKIIFTDGYEFIANRKKGWDVKAHDLDRYGKPEERTEFKSKVEESIYRTKKHLLKTKGSY